MKYNEYKENFAKLIDEKNKAINTYLRKVKSLKDNFLSELPLSVGDTIEIYIYNDGKLCSSDSGNIMDIEISDESIGIHLDRGFTAYTGTNYYFQEKYGYMKGVYGQQEYVIIGLNGLSTGLGPWEIK